MIALLFLSICLLCLPACAQAQELPYPSAKTAGTMDIKYATQFSVDYMEDGYSLIRTGEDAYLLVPPDGEVPEGVTVPVLRQPLENIYLASSSAMDLFRMSGALGSVTMTSTREENWSIPEVGEAVKNGDILYVGKYSAPDYEAVLAGGCSLAVENTMIYHCPETKEQLERLGIPVLVERSSYEPHPLGRVEWIRLYGLLAGKSETADAFFEESVERLKSVEGLPKCGKTAAFFYITSSGYANVRKSGDYVSKMIELAGGTYLAPDPDGEDENALSTVNMQLENFYMEAKDADVLIYNSTVAGELETMEDFLKISPLLADFKAVKTGDVWCTEQNMFQQVSGTAEMIEDLHTVFCGGDGEARYLHKLR